MKRFIFPLLSLCVLFNACNKQEPDPAPEPEVETLTYRETGLPVICITTSDLSAIKSKETYKNAYVSIDGIGKFKDLDLTDCLIKGHGNSTWGYKKSSYLFKFDKRTSVLGLPKHKRWILLANYLDKTLMRNSVAYKISSLTSLKYTPRNIQCELVLNGNHVGTYLLIEQIRIDKNRLDIDEETSYLFELDGHYNNEIQWMDPHGKAELSKFKDKGIPFSIKYPDPNTITSEQIQLGKDYIYQTAEAVYKNDFSELDLQSFADYFIVFETTINHELMNPCSVYMYKEMGKKLAAGPAWDFDWGTFSYVDHSAAKTGFLNQNAIWYAQLLKNSEFKAVLLERWKILYPILKRDIPPYIEEQREALRKSAKLNFSMWDPMNRRNTSPITGDEKMEFDDAVTTLKTIYLEHLETMNKVISQWDK